jgi:phage tail sheath gpL-like
MVAWASGPMEQRPAVYVAGMTDIVDSYANIKTLGGTTLNDGRASLPYLSYASDNLAKTEPFKVGAGYAAVLASTSDPAVPYDGAVITNVAAPAVIDRWTRTQQEDLLNNGITPLAVIPGEQVAIVRAISTYTLNSQSLADPTLLDLTTIRSLDYVRAQVRTRLSARFQRAKLSTRTPKMVRSQILDVLYLLQGLEIVQDVDTWKAGVIVERDTQSVGQLNCKIPSAVVPGLHVICGVIDLILY